MWTPGRFASVCAGVVATLAVVSCSGPDPEPTMSAPPSSTSSPSASPTDSSPSAPSATSQAAGIPTVEPSPSGNTEPGIDGAHAVLTLATIDEATGSLVVGGYVAGVVEDGGACTYTVTPEGGAAVRFETVGVENNGNTSCGSMTVPASKVPAGSYVIALEYANASGRVTSETIELEVP